MIYDFIRLGFYDIWDFCENETISCFQTLCSIISDFAVVFHTYYI